MGKFSTEQEDFWAGDFGRDYIARNEGANRIAQVVPMFADILRRTRDVTSILELGANVGNNMHALRALLPDVQLSAVEINEGAFAKLSAIPGVAATHGSLYDIAYQNEFDLVFTRGVLIHLPPQRLTDVYDACYRASRRYVLFCEYYNPSPVEIEYRGHANRLFKRDFAGEMMDRHGMRLVDYGFVWRRDPVAPQDDTMWVLMEK